jgi:enoyl-CoA hydratase/carnithine racemase
MSGHICSEKEGAIGWLIVEHEARRNALNDAMWRQIPEVAAALDADPEVRVIVMRGAGEEAFVSGADISEFAGVRMGESARRYEESNARAFAALANVKKPLLAMIHGFCIGGGVAISVSADLRYASEDAVFAVPAARLGLAYPLAGAEALIELVGASHAKELFFTARRFTASEALRLGLLNEVFPKAELQKRVGEIASAIADNAPLTLRAIKCAALELGKPSGMRDFSEAEAVMRACFESQDYAEGVSAFLEKRRPHWKGC